MFDLFVSYARPQVEWATHLRGLLTGPGIRTFVAERDLRAGDSLSEAISAQINSCDLVLLLWTEDAARSDYVGKEVFLAKAEGKPIIPVNFHPDVPLPEELGDVKYLDVSEDQQTGLQWLRAEVAQRAHDKKVSNFIAIGVFGLIAWAALSE